MKKIAIVPVKNEDWILEKTLTALSLFCDHIIVGDAGSWDKTRQIIDACPKAVFVNNTSPHMGSVNRRQLILNKAREFGEDNLIFVFDADEIPSANILADKQFWNDVERLSPGQSIELEWMTLWKSIRQFRDDTSVWAHQYKPFIFRDDGITNYSPGDVHESKVPEGFGSEPNRNESIKVLHFHFVLWERMLAKQAYIRTRELLQYGRSPWFINFRYGITKEERGMVLRNAPKEWLNGYVQYGITLENLLPSPVYWYEVEVLRSFKQFGPEKFKWLDIWDIPWEQKRLSAADFGFDGIPEIKISDPRNIFIKIYHKLLYLFSIQELIAIYSKVKSLWKS
jgi:hypothetical protein